MKLTPILEPVQTFLTPKNINYKLSFFPFTLYFSSFTKAKAKVYNISSSSSSLSLSEVMSAQFCSVLNFFASSVEINLF